MPHSRRRLHSLVIGAALVAASAATAEDPPRVTPMTPDVVDKYEQVLPSADFVRREAMVPMRDGVKLYTVIVMKKGTRKGPILLSRVIRRLKEAGMAAAEADALAPRMLAEQAEINARDLAAIASGEKVPHVLKSARRAGLLEADVLAALGLAEHPFIRATLRSAPSDAAAPALSRPATKGRNPRSRANIQTSCSTLSGKREREYVPMRTRTAGCSFSVFQCVGMNVACWYTMFVNHWKSAPTAPAFCRGPFSVGPWHCAQPTVDSATSCPRGALAGTSNRHPPGRETGGRLSKYATKSAISRSLTCDSTKAGMIPHGFRTA